MTSKMLQLRLRTIQEEIQMIINALDEEGVE